jgi:hypothetical protein
MRREPIINLDTTNISFIQTAVDLKKLGIKNHTFFLRLYDISLKNIDPFDPNLTDDQIIRITNECIINPWFYIRECCRIPDQGNVKGVKFLLNRATLASIWCMLNGLDNYLTISRQIGKTQSIIAAFNWAYLFGTTNSEIALYNMDSDKSIENLTRMKEQQSLLPPYLQMKTLIDGDKEITGIDNVKKIKNPVTNNTVVTKPKATSISTAEKIGRGSTQNLQYFDEFEFTDHIKTIMEANGPAFGTASRNAKKNNAMYCRVFSSTPGDLDSKCGMEALSIIEDMYPWTEKFYDWDDIEDIRDCVNVNSRNGIIYIEYTYKQLGKDENWFAEVSRLVNNNPLKIKREILLKRMRGSDSSPYEAEDLAQISERMKEPIEDIFIHKLFKLDIYTKLVKDRVYFIGVDVASGYGADNSAVTILDPYSLCVVGEFQSPFIGVPDLIKFLHILVKKYIPNALLIIESNANGVSVISHLRETDVGRNVYFDSSRDSLSDDMIDKLDNKGFLKYEANRRRAYGVTTTEKSRDRMFGLLDTHIKDHKDKFVGKNLTNDILKLVRLKSGKIAAGQGFHDDAVMSYLLILYVYYFGPNLARFGFVRGTPVEEEERNKGASYDEIIDLLDDSEKEFLGIDNNQKSEYMFDIKSVIESNRVLLDEVNEENSKKKKQIHRDRYEQEIYREMLKAEQQSQSINKRFNLQNTYEDLDNEFDDSVDFVDMGLFDELNS